jgi:hypothetical protein
MRHELQQLRDRAEAEYAAALGRGDRDSADAWERVGLELDRAQEAIAHDWRLIEQRRPRD